MPAFDHPPESAHGMAPLELDTWLPADPGKISEIRHAAHRAFQEIGIDSMDSLSLDLALGEALANAVRHGVKQSYGSEEASSKVHLEVWDYHDQVIVQVSNYGADFHPPTPPYRMPSASVTHTGGRGLPLMQCLTDAMLLEEIKGGGTTVFLIKKIRSAP